MEQLMLFNNEEFGQVRVVRVDNKEMFVARDIALALGYSDTSQAIRNHCKGVVETTAPTKGGKQVMKVIGEGDVYRLIIRSKLPSAEKFEKWVFEEVLPQIRQTGGYIPVSEQDDEEALLAKALIIAQKTIEKKTQIIAQQKQVIEYQEPLVELAKKRLDKNGLISITDATKTFNLKRGKITKWAKDNGYLHKTLNEVNIKGNDYFRVYDNAGYKCVGVTEEGIQLINKNLDDINSL